MRISTKQEIRRSEFFCNNDCEYFPCHDLNSDEFNCLFCYCPLYLATCLGKPRYIQVNDVKIKDCSLCAFPHRPENYKTIIECLTLKSEERVCA
ncbi:MAG: hypothetical protein JSV13_05110 [Nitrospiraceae bacterium]|nr:MAG: hypothetical protein JSV13_05110 [Nitrospiraceae bacterium]